eukprot:403376384
MLQDISEENANITNVDIVEFEGDSTTQSPDLFESFVTGPQIVKTISHCPNFQKFNDTLCSTPIKQEFSILTDNIGMIRKKKFIVQPGKWCLVVIQNRIFGGHIGGCMKIDSVSGNQMIYSDVFNFQKNFTVNQIASLELNVSTSQSLSQAFLNDLNYIDAIYQEIYKMNDTLYYQGILLDSVITLYEDWDQSSLLKVPGEWTQRYVFVYNPDEQQNLFQIKISHSIRGLSYSFVFLLSASVMIYNFGL